MELFHIPCVFFFGRDGSASRKLQHGIKLPRDQQINDTKRARKEVPIASAGGISGPGASNQKGDNETISWNFAVGLWEIHHLMLISKVKTAVKTGSIKLKMIWCSISWSFRWLVMAFDLQVIARKVQPTITVQFRQVSGMVSQMAQVTAAMITMNMVYWIQAATLPLAGFL